MLYENYLNSWSSVVGFGTIRPDFTDIEEGVIFGIWETGPWIAVKYTQDGPYNWLALGENFMPDLQIWRHTCFTLDFVSGETKLVENGVVRFVTKYQDINTLGDTMNHVAAGCFFRPSGTGYQSMYGRITDIQIFSSVLPNSDLERITGCQDMRQGDVLRWDNTQWVMTGAKTNIKKERLELETFICNFPTRSFHIIPLKKNFKSESLNLCQKFSAQVAAYTTEEEFTELTRYLSGENIMQATQCQDRVDIKERTLEMSAWLGNDDNDQEGIWTNWYTKNMVSHFPWADGRPYAGGVRYNCMGLDVQIRNTGDTFGEVEGAVIGDEECENAAFCPICEISHSILKIFVRGLCRMSMFNDVYMYNIDSKGEIIYLGEQTSRIYYDKIDKMWVWLDKKSKNSRATSSSTYSSLLIGVHEVDFGKVEEDACQADGVVRRLKFTTCIPGEFTCNDGQCVGIEKRCDQTSHCNDQSDEENCKIIHMEKRYNKKIPPFYFSKQDKKY